MFARNSFLNLSKSLLKSSLGVPLIPSNSYQCASRFLTPSLKALNSGPNGCLWKQHGQVNMSSNAPGASSTLEAELKSFLDEEIKAEKSNSAQVKGMPGFTIIKDGSNIRLKRGYKDEQITIKVDVNASTVDDEVPASDDQPPPIVSKPDFAVEIRKPNGKALCITCHFIKDVHFDEDPNEENAAKNEKDDVFAIEAFTVVDDKNIDSDLDIDDNVYLGDASLVDGQLYDLLMDYLDERGIGKEFSNSLIEYCTAYEHERYVELLEKLRNFVK